MFIRLNTLTKPEAVDFILATILPSDIQADTSVLRSYTDHELISMALHTLVGELRSKARIDAWKVLRSAYPQFDLGSNKSQGKGGSEEYDASRWLIRVLALSIERLGVDEEAFRDDMKVTVERWFTEREKIGEVQRAGPSVSGSTVEDRWIVKIRR